MKRSPSNRGANLSSAAAAAPLRRLLPAAPSSLAGGDPCCTVVEGHAADTAAAAAPHLISRGPGDDDGRTMRTRGRAAPPLGSDGTVGG